nr:unnamed protein product [Callosobruchus chinensis]
MGTIQTMVRLPTAEKQKKGRYNDRLWITVKWPVPHKTYCSTGNNELVQWTIPKCGGDGLKDFVEKDWKIPSEHLVCTTTHDGQLICYRIDGEEAEVEKLATYLTCISATCKKQQDCGCCICWLTQSCECVR